MAAEEASFQSEQNEGLFMVYVELDGKEIL